MHGFEGMGGGWMIFWWIIIILVIAGLTSWLVRLGSLTKGKAAKNQQSAREILDERYARGEIDRDEYLQKKKDLESNT